MLFLKYFLFTIISSVEYIAIIVFSLVLFRINPSWYKPQILFVCVSLSYLSFTMRGDDLTHITPFVQLLALILMLWLMFHIHPGYAALLGTIGYLAYGLLQGALLLIAGFFIEQIEPYTLSMYSIALLTSSIAFLGSFYIRKSNKGYSFVPHSDEVRISQMRRGTKLKFLLVGLFLLVGVAFVFWTYYFTLSLGTWTTFLLVILLLCVEVAVLVYMSNKWEQREGDNDD